MQGTIDRVVPEGRYGFLIGPNGEEYFFHQSGLNGPEFEVLGPGVPVFFEIGQSTGDEPDEHLRAVRIELLPDAEPAIDNETPPPEKVAGPGA